MKDLDFILDNITLDMKIYGYLFTVTNKVQAMGDKVVQGLTMRQQYLMIILSKFEDYAPTLQELAYVFGSSYQNVKRMASQLEDEDFLEIRKDPIDRRKIRIIINRKKFNLLRSEMEDANKVFFEHVLKNISTKEKEQLAQVLSKIDANVDLQVESK